MAKKIDEINRLYDSYNKQTHLIQQYIAQISSMSQDLSDDARIDSKQVIYQLRALQDKTNRLEQKISSERSRVVQSVLKQAEDGAYEGRVAEELREELARSHAAHKETLEQLSVYKSITERQRAQKQLDPQFLLQSTCVRQTDSEQLMRENEQLKEEISALMDQNEAYRSGVHLQESQLQDQSRDLRASSLHGLRQSLHNSATQGIMDQNRLIQENQVVLIEQNSRLKAVLSSKLTVISQLQAESSAMTQKARTLEQDNQLLQAQIRRLELQLQQRGLELHASKISGDGGDFARLAQAYTDLQQENYTLKQAGSRGDVAALKATQTELNKLKTEIKELREAQQAFEQQMEVVDLKLLSADYLESQRLKKESVLAWANDFEQLLQRQEIESQ